MPDSPIDDPFADLFGKLPDPRNRATGAVPTNSTDGDGAAMTPESQPPAAPSSRRAARAAAATGATPMSPPPISAPIDVPAPDRRHGIELRPAGTAHAAAAARAASPQAATTTVLSTESDPDDWPFAGANGAAPALPYSRTGGNRVITAPAPDATPHGDDLDDLFSGTGSSDTLGQVPPRPNKRRRRIGGWIALAVVLMLFGGVAAGGLWVWNTYEAKIREFMGWEEPKDYAEGQANGEALVTISSGDNGNTISTSLYEAGVTKTPDAFYDMLVDTAQNPTFYPGVYRLQKQMTSAAALAALQDPANKIENSALIREGLTVEQTLPSARRGHRDLRSRTSRLRSPTPSDVRCARRRASRAGSSPRPTRSTRASRRPTCIATMVDRTVLLARCRAACRSKTPGVLTIASIIQSEARFDRPTSTRCRASSRTASIPDNQETFGLLQMDSTAQYGYGELHDGTVSSSDGGAHRRQPVEHLRAHRACRSGRSPTPATTPSTRRCTRPTATGCTSSPSTWTTGETVFTEPTPITSAPSTSGRTGARKPDSDADHRRIAASPSGATRSSTAGRRSCTPPRTACSGSTGRTSVGASARPSSRPRSRARRVVARTVADDAAEGRRLRRGAHPWASRELTGAVNTLLLGPDGPRGFNTDVGGIVRALGDEGIDRGRRSARIVGAGATATSALVALAELGAHQVEVVARRPDAVAPPRRRSATSLGIAVRRGALRPRPTHATVARHDLDRFPAMRAIRGCRGRRTRRRTGDCCSTSSTDTGRRCSRRRGSAPGGRATSGLGMLLHQALLQVRIFAGGAPDVPLDDESAVLAAMREAVVGD